MRQGLSLGASGVGFYGSDIGGFFSVSCPPAGPELLCRWVELGAFSGVMRTESQGWTAPWWEWLGFKRSQVWDPEVLPVWRRYSKLRTQMYPYLDAAGRAYVERGVPLMADVRLIYPDENASWSGRVRYMFGPDILVVPILEEGGRETEAPLPGGTWRSLWQAVRYDVADGSFHLAAASPLAGGSTVTVGAPLDEIPAFVRGGSLLPLLTPDVDTLAEYGGGPGLVRLCDRADRLRLLAWPEGISTVEALGVKIRSNLTGDTWRLRLTGKPLQSLEIEAQVPGTPLAVLWNGQPLDPGAWTYAEGVLSLPVEGSGTLVVGLEPAR